MIQLLMFTHMGLDEADYGILEWDFHVWSTLCVWGLRAHRMTHSSMALSEGDNNLYDYGTDKYEYRIGL